jgi:uncharacterized protein (TIGR00369 family)
MNEIIPLNKLLGIEITTVGNGIAEARLPFRPEVTNHIGSVHASAIFGLGEAASGGAMSGSFAPIVTTIRAVAAGADVSFLKIARTDLVAFAKVDGRSEEMRERLLREGKVVFDVLVDVKDVNDIVISSMRFSWHVSRKN